MFDTYKKKLERLNADVPKIFERAQVKGIVYFERKAKDLSDKLIYDKPQSDKIDYKRTGNFKREWRGTKLKVLGKYAITFINDVEYASHLEYGHRVNVFGKDMGYKTKGLFIGRQSVDHAMYNIIKYFDKELEKAMRAQ